jgi:hypothetical protein
MQSGAIRLGQGGSDDGSLVYHPRWLIAPSHIYIYMYIYIYIHIYIYGGTIHHLGWWTKGSSPRPTDPTNQPSQPVQPARPTRVARTHDQASSHLPRPSHLPLTRPRPSLELPSAPRSWAWSFYKITERLSSATLSHFTKWLRDLTHYSEWGMTEHYSKWGMHPTAAVKSGQELYRSWKWLSTVAW